MKNKQTKSNYSKWRSIQDIVVNVLNAEFVRSNERWKHCACLSVWCVWWCACVCVCVWVVCVCVWECERECERERESECVCECVWVCVCVCVYVCECVCVCESVCERERERERESECVCECVCVCVSNSSRFSAAVIYSGIQRLACLQVRLSFPCQTVTHSVHHHVSSNERKLMLSGALRVCVCVCVGVCVCVWCVCVCCVCVCDVGVQWNLTPDRLTASTGR